MTTGYVIDEEGRRRPAGGTYSTAEMRALAGGLVRSGAVFAPSAMGRGAPARNFASRDTGLSKPPQN